MEQIKMTPEEFADLMEQMSDRSAEKTLGKVIALFGVKDDEEGRKILRGMGDSAKRASDFWEEMGCQARKGVVRAIITALTLVFFAGLGFLAFKFGITDKFVK